MKSTLNEAMSLPGSAYLNSNALFIIHYIFIYGFLVYASPFLWKFTITHDHVFKKGKRLQTSKDDLCTFKKSNTVEWLVTTL